MEIIRGSYNLKPEHHGCVATFGNFDGVHLGHQQLLKQLSSAAQSLKLPSTVITTEPLSREFFAPQTAPPRLTRLREKLEVFASFSIDRVLCLRFNQQLANISAEQFIQDLLLAKLGVKHLIIGDDTRFGYKRQGDFALLKKYAEENDFVVKATETFLLEGKRVSSSSIRAALDQGDMEKAQQLLDRPYHMSGRVAHGDKRGRTLGYPTANIYLNRKQTPLLGIFAVEVGGIDSTLLPGVASIGVRPTFGGGVCLLEVHIFNFNQDIYGRHVDVYFRHKLRDTEKFATAEALIEQMHIDAKQAQQFFAGDFAHRRTYV
ncbi:MAG: bifunctional riboflavin kinase/FAD synthetase [Gammaproteobacteria bacterium]|nr:bifunctional riboflavin kinase/FAD synthetase [Gammaproteobacteria bacterium]